jgi:hypothetical protein
MMDAMRGTPASRRSYGRFSQRRAIAPSTTMIPLT